MIHYYLGRIADYQQKLSNLLASESIKYSAWPPNDSSSIRNSAGIYHFFEKINGRVESVYVGKGGFGKGDEWSLCSRIKQHFQPSQKYTLLGKASKATCEPPTQVKAALEAREIYVQWITLATREAALPSAKIEDELRWFECFCIAVLRPRYSNA